MLHRLSIQINGLLDIIESLFGVSSLEAQNLRRVVKNEVQSGWAQAVGHLQEPFFVGIFSMTMADDAFYGGLVCIVSAKLGGMPPLAAPLAHAAAYFPDSQTKRRML